MAERTPQEGLIPSGPQLPGFWSQGQAGLVVVEYLAVEVRNRHTRKAYSRAGRRFAEWATARGATLADVTPMLVAAYVEQCGAEMEVSSIKQHLTALHMLFGALVRRGVLDRDPTASVRAPRQSITQGKTPALSATEMKQLLDSIGASRTDVRDRAMILVMAYGFVRVGALVRMKVKDFHEASGRWWFRLAEKNGKRLEVPAHPEAQKAVAAWLGQRGDHGPEDLLFESMHRKGPLDTNDVLRMVKRRVARAGLPESICCHSFRATGITEYLRQGGRLEQAQRLAGHAHPGTTKLYDRNEDFFAAEELDRMRL